MKIKKRFLLVFAVFAVFIFAACDPNASGHSGEEDDSSVIPEEKDDGPVLPEGVGIDEFKGITIGGEGSRMYQFLNDGTAIRYDVNWNLTKFNSETNKYDYVYKKSYKYEYSYDSENHLLYLLTKGLYHNDVLYTKSEEFVNAWATEDSENGIVYTDDYLSVFVELDKLYLKKFDIYNYSFWSYSSDQMIWVSPKIDTNLGNLNTDGTFDFDDTFHSIGFTYANIPLLPFDNTTNYIYCRMIDFTETTAKLFFIEIKYGENGNAEKASIVGTAKLNYVIALDDTKVGSLTGSIEDMDDALIAKIKTTVKDRTDCSDSEFDEYYNNLVQYWADGFTIPFNYYGTNYTIQ